VVLVSIDTDNVLEVQSRSHLAMNLELRHRNHHVACQYVSSDDVVVTVTLMCLHRFAPAIVSSIQQPTINRFHETVRTQTDSYGPATVECLAFPYDAIFVARLLLSKIDQTERDASLS